MGFFGVMGRLVQGKPAFVDPKYEEAKKTTSGGGSFNPLTVHEEVKNQLVDEHGRKVVPELKVEHLKSHRSGDQMTTTAWVTNSSTHRVRIDDVRLLKQKVVIHRELGPGEGREIQLYHGRVADNDHEHKAEIVYRLHENGDRFQAEYHVEYNRESDGKYTIEELHPNQAIRDI